MLWSKLLKSRTTYFYLVPALVAGIGWLIYSSDEEPPLISEFSISPATVEMDDTGALLNYSGSLSDSRGITQAHFLCKEDGEAKLQLYLGFNSIEANLVSFGVLPGSPTWQGTWEGNSQNLLFQGTGRIPAGFQGAKCSWSVELSDILGNSTKIELPNQTVVSG